MFIVNLINYVTSEMLDTLEQLYKDQGNNHKIIGLVYKLAKERWSNIQHDYVHPETRSDKNLKQCVLDMFIIKGYIEFLIQQLRSFSASSADGLDKLNLSVEHHITKLFKVSQILKNKFTDIKVRQSSIFPMLVLFHDNKAFNEDINTIVIDEIVADAKQELNLNVNLISEVEPLHLLRALDDAVSAKKYLKTIKPTITKEEYELKEGHVNAKYYNKLRGIILSDAKLGLFGDTKVIIKEAKEVLLPTRCEKTKPGQNLSFTARALSAEMASEQALSQIASLFDENTLLYQSIQKLIF